jgi:macrodomain Ter protein organizer (MatP/YcbG family)
MTTVTVDLDDAVYARLAAEARKQKTTVADVLAALARSRAQAGVPSEQAADMARAHLAQYPELFRKLAE